MLFSCNIMYSPTQEQAALLSHGVFISVAETMFASRVCQTNSQVLLHTARNTYHASHHYAHSALMHAPTMLC
ncbi:hypothetical protein E2C01_053309 [Portunus trituberculatus]|uniref:Uncharacterized protein n=1 Tax=Portunus trituberculatus TaxID=210409 RepID=A0A5B7GP10_PORTR|nr:hypothetical protein [Portunus trituberculatus]